MILRFNLDEYRPLKVEDYPGPTNDPEAFAAMVEGINEKAQKGQGVDCWTPNYLGYVHFFAGKDEEKSIQARLTAEEREWLHVELCERAIDTRDWAWQKMAEMGVISAEVEFSGGHDEGGADAIVLTRGDGSKESWPGYSTKDDDEGKLITYLTEPIYEEWGSFAGEFSVHGTLFWDCATQKVTLEGSESVEEYQSFDKEV
jgi:hypothetical protein